MIEPNKKEVMAENNLTQQELELLVKLIREYIERLEKQLQKDESELQTKGKNASVTIKIAEAKTLLKKLEYMFNSSK